MQCCHLVVWFMVPFALVFLLGEPWRICVQFLKMYVWYRLNWSIVPCPCVSSAVYVSSIPRWAQRLSQNTQSGIFTHIFCFLGTSLILRIIMNDTSIWFILNRLWGLGTSLSYPVGWILPDSQVFKIITTVRSSQHRYFYFCLCVFIYEILWLFWLCVQLSNWSYFTFISIQQSFYNYRNCEKSL